MDMMIWISLYFKTEYYITLKYNDMSSTLLNVFQYVKLQKKMLDLVFFEQIFFVRLPSML